MFGFSWVFTQLQICTQTWTGGAVLAHDHHQKQPRDLEEGTFLLG